MKRGVELSMNVIIIAAIALVVLVVLVLLVTNASQTIKDGTGCQAKQSGDCYYLNGETCSNYMGEPGYMNIASDCPDDDQTCCFRPLGGGEE